MLLDSADKSIEVVLAAKPVSECPVTAFYVDHIDTWGYPGSYDTATNGTTAVIVVAAPALVPPNATIQRQVKMITVYNPNQTSVVVYTQLNHGGTTRLMNMSVLAVGEALVYQNEIGFRIMQPTLPLFLQSSDLNIEAGTGDLQVDVLSMPAITGTVTSDVSDRGGRLLGKTTFYDTLINTTIDAAAETVELSCGGLGSVGIQIADSGGAWVGTLSFEGTIDGTNWVAIRAVKYGGILVYNTTINGIFFAQAGGLLKVRVRASAWTGGTCSIYMEGTTATNAVTIANSLPSPFTYAVSQGIITGSTPFSKLGFNGQVQNVEEDVWSYGGKYTFPGDAGAEVYAANANDDVAGTGIQKVKVYFLDNTFASQVEEVSLSGGNAVAMASAHVYRVNAIRASQVGANKVAAGLIQVRNLADAPVYRQIDAGYTRGRGLIYTVPLGKTLYITDVDVAGSSPVGGHYTRFTMRATYDEINNVTIGWFNALWEMTVQDNGLHCPLIMPIKIPATADIVMSVVSDGVAADAICQCSVRGWTE